MRAVVFAYHEIGFVCLDELIAFGADVLCLFTHKDDPGEDIWFKTPARLAEEHAIPVHAPETLKEPCWAGLVASLAPDVIFSFYYRNLIPKSILECARIGAFNLHGSLLPQFRGRCPVNWVLIAGMEKTGLTLHFMEEKPDTGDVVARRAIDIDSRDTAHTLFLKMIGEARPMMRDILPALRDGTFTRTPQSGLGPSSYFGGRKPEDGLISWEKDAVSVYNLMRAVTHPYPGAFTYLEGRKLFIWWAEPELSVAVPADTPRGGIFSIGPLRVNAGGTALRLVTVEMEGEGEMSGEVFAATHRLKNRTLGGNA